MSTTATDNVAVIRGVYDAFGRGDAEAIVARFADNVDFVSEAAAPTAPWHGRWSGKEGVGQFLAAIAASVEVLEFTPTSYTANDQDEVAVLITWACRNLANGREVKMNIHHHWQLRDGMIVRYRGGEDTALTATLFE